MRDGTYNIVRGGQIQSASNTNYDYVGQIM